MQSLILKAGKDFYLNTWIEFKEKNYHNKTTCRLRRIQLYKVLDISLLVRK